MAAPTDERVSFVKFVMIALHFGHDWHTVERRKREIQPVCERRSASVDSVMYVTSENTFIAFVTTTSIRVCGNETSTPVTRLGCVTSSVVRDVFCGTRVLRLAKRGTSFANGNASGFTTTFFGKLDC